MIDINKLNRKKGEMFPGANGRDVEKTRQNQPPQFGCTGKKKSQQIIYTKQNNRTQLHRNYCGIGANTISFRSRSKRETRIES